jgi:ribosomal protein L15
MNLDGAKGVKKTKDSFQIDLSAMGYQKLLGAGSVKKAYDITTLYASQSAIEKIESAGGKVTVKKEVGGKAHAADTAEKTESSTES